MLAVLVVGCVLDVASTLSNIASIRSWILISVPDGEMRSRMLLNLCTNALEPLHEGLLLQNILKVDIEGLSR